MLAVLRSDSLNFPLLLHVLGASILVGTLIAASAAQLLAWRRRAPGDAVPFARIAFRTLLLGALPAWFLMRIGAEWIASREGWNDVDDEPLWLGIGYLTAEPGGLLLLVSIVLAGIGARRLARTDAERGGTLVRVATVISFLLVVAYVIAVWAMSAKPG
jgi:uncharacterized membrane protein